MQRLGPLAGEGADWWQGERNSSTDPQKVTFHEIKVMFTLMFPFHVYLRLKLIWTEKWGRSWRSPCP